MWLFHSTLELASPITDVGNRKQTDDILHIVKNISAFSVNKHSSQQLSIMHILNHLIYVLVGFLSKFNRGLLQQYIKKTLNFVDNTLSLGKVDPQALDPIL